MKKISQLTLLILFCLLIGQGIYVARKGFNPRKLLYLENTKESCINEETKQILSQPFYFLGKGRQCFAFASKDGKYVLKCPRTNIYKIPFWARVLPVKAYREKIRADKNKRQRFVFESFRLAQEELQDVTGMIAIHLGKSEQGYCAPSGFVNFGGPQNGADLGGREEAHIASIWATSDRSKMGHSDGRKNSQNLTVRSTAEQLILVDSLGIRHHLPMHTTSFILQHKQPLWTPLFLKAQKNQDAGEQRRLLNALVDIIIQRAKQGTLNRDRSFLRNYGFDGVRAYQIDVGDFFQLKDWDPSQVFQKAVSDSLAPVQEWLAKIDPPMLDVLNRRLELLQGDVEKSHDHK